FVFDAASVSALSAALDRIYSVWRDPVKWAALRRQGMHADFGWEPSARRYLALYRELRPQA
ncbi:MAG: starch synthase, partial [Acidobacteriota bacterium]